MTRLRIELIRGGGVFDEAEGGAVVARQRLAAEFYAYASHRHRRHIMWDMPEEERRETLANLAGRSHLGGFAWLDGEPLACAFASPLCRESPTLEAHFMFVRIAGRQWQSRCGWSFVKSCLARHGHIIALVPAPYLGARRFLGELGFYEAARLPGCCWLHDHGRARDGILLRLDGGAGAILY